MNNGSQIQILPPLRMVQYGVAPASRAYLPDPVVGMKATSGGPATLHSGDGLHAPLGPTDPFRVESERKSDR
jgi:hypothetical protein